jgi:hypothetical protein
MLPTGNIFTCHKLAGGSDRFRFPSRIGILRVDILLRTQAGGGVEKTPTLSWPLFIRLTTQQVSCH